MKKKYLLIIIFLILIAVGFEYLVLFTNVGKYSVLEKAIQSAGIFVALLAAVIALSTSDPKKKSVNIDIELSADRGNISTYPKNELSEELRDFYKDLHDPIKSYRVQFKMKNTSGFTLNKPTLTFRLPLQMEHPREGKKNNVYFNHTFNSNLYNSRENLRVLEFADTRILSNSNLPYWNDGESITIWIRMVLDEGKSEPFIVAISVNCENAEGITKEIKTSPMKIIMK